MKVFNWSKLPAQALNSMEDNVWKEVLEMDDKVKVRYELIEELFCQKSAAVAKTQDQPKAKAPTEVNLLDTKRSMNANIFLKQFKASNEEVVVMIQKGQQARIGAERLKGLQNILPEKEEVEMIRGYEGDKEKLGNAEKFYLLLSSLPHFKMRIEGMLLKEDFRVAMDSLKPNVGVIIRACEELMDSETLKVFLRYVLHTGNFINAGGYAGNALGFKVASLTKLMDTRANKPRMTLLHHLVAEAQKEAHDVLDFAQQLLPVLAEASRLKVDNLTSERRQLEASVNKLNGQVTSAGEDVKEQFQQFIQEAKEELKETENKMETVKELTHKLCMHFVENEKTFKLEECLNIFKTFCEKVIQCKKENEQRKLQEERAEKRRKEHEAMKARSKDSKDKPPQEDDGCIIDRLLTDIRRGYTLRKTSPSKKDGKSTRASTSPPKTTKPQSTQDKTPSPNQPKDQTEKAKPTDPKDQTAKTTTTTDPKEHSAQTQTTEPAKEQTAKAKTSVEAKQQPADAATTTKPAPDNSTPSSNPPPQSPSTETQAGSAAAAGGNGNKAKSVNLEPEEQTIPKTDESVC